MALNRTKVLEAAQKYLQKGQHDKAIAEYQKLVKEDPRDVRTLLKIGDLHTRRGSTTEAIETYGQVAEQYAKQGFFLKAVAVYKQILKLNPDQLDVCERLAGMYEELALVSDALKTYEAVSDGYARAGNIDKSLETMQKMIDLDPDNIAVHIKFAEALSRAERADEAAEAFAVGANLLKEQDRMDDYIRVAERQLYHQPANDALAKELSSLYLERKDAKRALAKLQLCFKNDPRDIQTLEMLAEAFRQLGQGSKTISVLREIARIHGELGADEPRKRALSRILDLDPDDQEARQALGVAPKGPDRKFGATMIDSRSPEERAEDAAAREAAAAEEELDEVSDAELLVDAEDDDILIVEEEKASRAPEPAKSERPPETTEQRVARLLEEADMQAAAGFWLEVEGLLEEVLELSSEEVGARERLKDLYLQLGRDEEAVGQLLLLADACAETDVGRAIGYMQHAVRLAPNDPRPKLRLEGLDAEQIAQSSRPPAETVDVSEDPLEQPILPDEFDSAPLPVPSAAPPDADLDALLDAPIEDDFGPSPAATAPEPAKEPQAPRRPDAAAARNAQYTMDALPRISDVDDLLDGAMQSGPPRGGAEAEREDALEAPLDDDFEVFDEPSDGAATAEPASSAPPPTEPGTRSAPPLPTEPGPSSTPPSEPAASPAASAAPEDPMALLDAPIEDDFGVRPPSPRGGATPDFSLLDAPIEDDFGAPASEPEPIDDFGLADPRFDQSDLIQADVLADARRATGPAAGAEDSVEELDLPADEVTAQSEIPGEMLARQAEEELAEPGETPTPGELPEEDEVPLLLDSEVPPPDEELDVTAAPPADSVTVVPGPPEEVAAAAEQEAATAEPPAAELPVEAPAELAPEAPAETAAPTPEAENPEIEETVDEAEFFFSQGMVDDAIEAIQEALLIYPDSALLQAKLSEFESAADAKEAEQVTAEPEREDESFKLAEQLAEQLGDLPEEPPGEAIDVEQVFEQFKRGVAEQVSADDSATHFDLAIAYKEMGLVEDAMDEFRIAASDPKRECMARTMIGMCMMEQGDANAAIEEFRTALAAKQKDDRAELGLHYEIGTAHQMLGDLPAAMKEFERVADRDPHFRDVQAKLDELRPQVPKKEDDSDDLDRAFDDLMGDD